MNNIERLNEDSGEYSIKAVKAFAMSGMSQKDVMKGANSDGVCVGAAVGGILGEGVTSLDRDETIAAAAPEQALKKIDII